MSYTLRYYADGTILFNDPRLCEALEKMLLGGEAVTMYHNGTHFVVAVGDREAGMVFNATSHIGCADKRLLARAVRHAVGVEYGIGQMADQLSGWGRDRKPAEVDALDVPSQYDAIRETFHNSLGTSDVKEHDGSRFTIVRNLRVGTEVDEEVAPMYLVRFEDGKTTGAFPDEIFE